MTSQRNILGTVGPRIDAGIVADALIGSDGTITTTGRRYNGAGILVAIPAFAAAYDISEFDAGQIHLITRLWVEDNSHAIVNHPAPFYRPRFFGSWVDNGTLYLDIVEAFSREEIDEAIAAGADRNQIAIWDNGRQELIATGGNGAVA